MNTMIQMLAAWSFILTLMLVLRYRRTLAQGGAKSAPVPVHSGAQGRAPQYEE